MAAGLCARFALTLWVALPGASTLVISGDANAQCPAEPPVGNYTGGGTVACPCFIPGEQAGAVLDVPAGHYPIEILKIRVGWGSQFGGQPQSIEQALHVYPAGLPNPGTPQFSLEGPVLTDGVINEFDIEFVAGNKIVNSGPFTVALEFLSQSAGNAFAASVVHDGNGCQPAKNVVFAIPGGWSDACVLGVTGDWVFEVVYRQVACNTCPLNCPAGDADGIIGTANNRSVDLDSNGTVALTDLSVFATAFTSAYDYCADFDCDGIIGLVDLSTFAQHYGHNGAQFGACN